MPRCAIRPTAAPSDQKPDREVRFSRAMTQTSSSYVRSGLYVATKKRDRASAWIRDEGAHAGIYLPPNYMLM